MVRRRLEFTAGVVGAVVISVTNHTYADTQRVALTGQQAPGTPQGAVFREFLNPVLNNAGQVAFNGFLQSGAGGGVTFDNSEGIWAGEPQAIELVAREGSQAPGRPDGASYDTFFLTSSIVIDGQGRVAFNADLKHGPGGVGEDNDSGIWWGSSGAVQSVAHEGNQAPGVPAGAVYNDLYNASNLAINDSGQLTFSGFLLPGSGGVNDDNWRVIWAGSPDSLQVVARQGQSIPGGPTGAEFSGFLLDAPAINSHGEVAFTGFWSPSPGNGIWTNAPGALTLVARKGQRPPGLDPGITFDDFDENFLVNSPALNDAGQVVFKARVDDGSIFLPFPEGIWAGNAGALQLVAMEGHQAPGTPLGARFNSLREPILNAAGQVVFSSSLDIGSGGVDLENNSGIWLGTPGAMSLLIREGQQAPGIPDGGVFTGAFLAYGIQDTGLVGFTARLKQGQGDVDSTNDRGLWLGNADEMVLVARRGDTLDGRFVSSVFIDSTYPGGQDGRRSFINDMGQVLYTASFLNGDQGLYLYTPSLNWKPNGGGNWDDNTHWTLGLTPDYVHDVTLAPASDATIVGPANDVTIQSLTVGGGAGVATLQLGTGALGTTQGLHITPNGQLSGQGTVHGTVFNQGSVAGPTTVGDELAFAGEVIGTGGYSGNIEWLESFRTTFVPGIGLDTAIVTIEGNLTLGPGATLHIQINGPTPGTDHDQIIVTDPTSSGAGVATLGGTLSLTVSPALLNSIQYGDTFEIMTFESHEGGFDQVLGAFFASEDLALAPVFRDNSLVLVATGPGDVNGDGQVTLADFAPIQINYNQPGNYEDGDLNGDGIVSIADFALMQNNYTKVYFSPSLTAGDAAAVAPEPNTAAIWAMAMLSVSLTRRRHA